MGSYLIYIHRDYRGKQIGQFLLSELEKVAKEEAFHKIVLFTFTFNRLGQGLYKKRNFRGVGIFVKQGKIDGKYVDVMIMEKLLDES